MKEKKGRKEKGTGFSPVLLLCCHPGRVPSVPRVEDRWLPAEQDRLEES